MQNVPRFLLFFISIFIAALGLYEAIAWGKSTSSNKPHIIYIIADDMGWNDVSFHGSNQIPTPNIDALAYNGVILNRHYVLPVCTPSRTALLTGRYPIREGLQGFPLRAGEPRGLPLETTLMPEYLRNIGYSTHLVGKWHVGYETQNHTPANRGFDTFYGYYSGYISYFGHWISEVVENKVHQGFDFHRDRPNSFGTVNETGYFTDLITDEAVKIIRNNGNDKPLFLQISHLAVHATLADELLEVRNKTEVDKTFSYIKNDNRRKYAGMMQAMDESVGKVVTTLNKMDMLKNSIIVFISDNGAPTVGLYENYGSNYPLRGMKNTLYEGGVRGVALVYSQLINSFSRVSDRMMHITDWLPTLYAAAGGNITDLKNIDGLNQWPSIVNDSKSPRQSMLINIDEITKSEGALNGRYKLIKGATDLCEQCYGDKGDSLLNPNYRVEDALSSPAGVAINQLRSHNLSTKKAQKLRQQSIVRCKPNTTNGLNCSESCLFDIIKDPCETRDIKKDHPGIVETLEGLISRYRKQLRAQVMVPVDPCALPERFNGTWMPWKTAESVSIFSNECQSPKYNL